MDISVHYNFLIHTFSSIAAAGHFFDNPTSLDVCFLILRIELPYAVAILNTSYACASGG